MTVSSRNGRLTPDQVQSVSFPPARFGRRGLDEETVLSFCDQVQHELVTLLNEKASLWEEVERLRRRIIDSGDPSGARPEDAHIQAVRILSNAQQMADKYVADAQYYSRQLTQDARRQRDEVLAEAKKHADRVLDEAHSRASRAADVMASEPGSTAGGEWRDRTAELAYLRTFSEVYRTHLRAYLETLLNNVEDWEQSEKESLAAARAELPFPFPPGAQGQPPAPAPGPTSYSVPAPRLVPRTRIRPRPAFLLVPALVLVSPLVLVPAPRLVPVPGSAPASVSVPALVPVPLPGPAAVAAGTGIWAVRSAGNHRRHELIRLDRLQRHPRPVSRSTCSSVSPADRHARCADHARCTGQGRRAPWSGMPPASPPADPCRHRRNTVPEADRPEPGGRKLGGGNDRRSAA
jgi:cell division septum initiation protein DivIVA